MVGAAVGTAGRTSVTNGLIGEMSGAERRAAWRTWLGLAVVTAGENTVNVFTVVHDRADAGSPIAVWEPIVWEASSGVCILAFAWVVWAAMRAAPPAKDRWLRFGLVHLVASLAFSLLHVIGMVVIRAGIYGLVGWRYRFAASQFLYEYRKDLITYVLIAAAFWAVREFQRRRAPVAAPDPTFDIRDGARIIRARPGEILAVSSAGNYVEFALADGRKPLMRTTLSGVEAALGPHGFVRTHRSWLVNAARVTELIADGSGDFTLRVGAEVEAPLSRRYPDALRRLRSASAAA